MPEVSADAASPQPAPLHRSAPKLPADPSVLLPAFLFVAPAQLSSLVFSKLSGVLRAEWCSQFVDEATALPSVPRPLQAAMLAAWADSAQEAASSNGVVPHDASGGGTAAAHGTTSRPALARSASARQPSLTIPLPSATSAASLSSSLRASLAALQRASSFSSAGGGGGATGLSSTTSLDVRQPPWSGGLPPPNTPLHVLNSADLPNSPASRLLAELLPKTPHHLALNRVLKLMKLYEPYVNRCVARSLAIAHEQVQVGNWQ